MNEASYLEMTDEALDVLLEALRRKYQSEHAELSIDDLLLLMALEPDRIKRLHVYYSAGLFVDTGGDMAWKGGRDAESKHRHQKARVNGLREHDITPEKDREIDDVIERSPDLSLRKLERLLSIK